MEKPMKKDARKIDIKTIIHSNLYVFISANKIYMRIKSSFWKLIKKKKNLLVFISIPFSHPPAYIVCFRPCTLAMKILNQLIWLGSRRSGRPSALILFPLKSLFDVIEFLFFFCSSEFQQSFTAAHQWINCFCTGCAKLPLFVLQPINGDAQAQTNNLSDWTIH